MLSFNSDDWPVFRDLTTSRLEILITQTICQTKGLQGLSILMGDVDEFSASAVIASLMYTRETLRCLFYNVRTTPNVNILDICGRQKLELLVLASCPKIEFLGLVSPEIAITNAQVTVELISKSSKLKTLCLWNVVFDDEVEFVDLESIVVFSRFEGESPLENVRVLDIGMNPNSINGV
ncbi:hypothetical protein L2E82_18760 [Cichorium intybus]|uniref:Uncharacterized protein n=1 Tax=Cichorium intybus TaxID=13427 RepID=A0ACB9FAS5_CICIN|nr:hypothetical protein L2E82_18760 [Cichorium intybus]